MSTNALPLHPTAASAARRPDRATSSARARVREWLLVAGLLALSGTYVLWHLRRGLIPHDDGAIGQAAERVMRGELPHRDFDDIYTGGLAYLNGWGFRLLGTSFWTMRLILLAAFLAWVPAVYFVASRFVRPTAAAAVTLLAVAWSVPSYPAPMPSWYNLFLATLGTAALLRGLDDPRRRWLVLGGVAGGLSILVKIVGLYYVAGVLLYLVFLSHAASRARRGPAAGRGDLYATVLSAGLLLFVAMLIGLVRHGLAAAEIAHFVVPGALLAAMLIHDEWACPAGPSGERFAALFRLLWPFAAGVALPLACFLVPYVRSGAVGDLLFGVFVLPSRRFSMASVPLMPLSTMVAVLPLLLAAGVARWRPMLAARVLPWLLVPSLIVLLVATESSGAAYRFVWYSARNLVPLLVMVGIWVLSRLSPAADDVPHRRAQLMLLMSVTALCSLVQFPFAIAVYFCYVAPLVILLVTALLRALPAVPPLIPGALLAFYLAFGVLRIDTSSLMGMGGQFLPYPATTPLAVTRAGIDVVPYQASVYQEVTRLLHEHARGGYTWASPDCPEVYFLSGLRNPTRSLFEFFDDPVRHRDRVVSGLERHGVTAIVLNSAPAFSSGITVAMYDDLARRFPSSADVGQFQVRWR